MRYGDFASLCERSPLPVCRVFGDAVLPTCFPKSYSIGESRLVNIPDFAMSIIAFLLMVYMGFKANRKLAAVGRREMALLLSLFCITLALNLAGADFIFASSKANKWLGVANTALEVSFFWALMLFGFVDTAFGISGGLKPPASDPLYSPGLFTVYLVFPLVAIFIYLVTQCIIVVKFLAVRLPMIWLLCSIVCFATAQILLFVASKKICTGSDNRIDGAFFATLLNTSSVFCIYGFWSSITGDDSEEYAGMYKF
ncbi:chitin synthase III catalytic subunit [Kickxella alabastrina]|uniref:chitin synthase III catalytic subunit n=1 Tax=Kickxella alabastrina TaxID=61397 RepID=UPI002220ED31|nr:chitin synthase III catalytic subunit [Kickxella alabastrina]KAI7830886.1 chitin synthase III catalytic subunit [Kickxella alabastrina]